MKFKEAVPCQKCGEAIELPGGVIEYTPNGNMMHIRHKQCSIGRNCLGTQISDFEVGGFLYSDEKEVYEHLKLIGNSYRSCFWACEKMIEFLFE